MKEPDLGELNSKVREKDERRACPLFARGGDFLLPLKFRYGRPTSRMDETHILDLVFVEIREHIDNYPG